MAATKEDLEKFLPSLVEAITNNDIDFLERFNPYFEGERLRLHIRFAGEVFRMARKHKVEPSIQQKDDVFHVSYDLPGEGRFSFLVRYDAGQFVYHEDPNMFPEELKT